jgi:hypothetical protein
VQRYDVWPVLDQDVGLLMHVVTAILACLNNQLIPTATCLLARMGN